MYVQRCQKEEKSTKNRFFLRKIWLFQKKAVTLHAFFVKRSTYRASGDCIRFDRIVVYARCVMLKSIKMK